jgi:putative DNA primase/helicase
VKAEKLAKQAEAAKKAIRLWSEARPDVDLKHTYLLAKGNIYPHGVKQLGQALLIPVYGQDKQLDGCQFIYGDGSKKFLTGTKKQGSFCYLKPANYQPNDTQMIYITEGWSTGVSVFMAMNNLVLVAFDKGNLKTVAMFVRSKYPQAKIVVCGDNDADGGGQQAAIEAAKAVDGFLAIPNGIKDFNDLHQAQGLGVVKMTIDAAIDSKKAAPSSEEDAAPKTQPSKPIIDDDLHGGDPIPLRKTLSDVMPFTEDLLPPTLSLFVFDEADRMPAAPSFVGTSLITALGSVIGASCGIKPKQKDDWLIVPNLWGGIVAPPTSKKTPAIDSGMRPLNLY